MDKHSINQENKGGDNVGRDKVTNIQEQHVYQSGDREIPKYLTSWPRLSETLIGRGEDLDRLKEKLASAGRVVVVNGMGGIGKTSLAAQYVQESLATWKHLAWIEQSDSFVLAMQTQANLANNLGIELSGEPEKDVAMVLNGLSNLAGPSLLVIDNAEGDIEPYLKQLPRENWTVLLTSRERLAKTELFPLDFLEKESAIQLFQTHYDLDPAPGTIERIVELVQAHTLTLEVLAKTAQNLEIQPLQKLVNLLEEKGLAIGKPVDFSAVEHYQGQNVQRLFPYLEAIFTLPDFRETELHLLKQFLVLPPELYTWDFLQKALGLVEEEPKDTYLFALKRLVKLGWINYSSEGYQMHRVIQEVLKKQHTIEWSDVEAWVEWLSEDLLSLDESK
ncbi:MAG: NB-ARC domain-containing protein, partial [Bacteroidota bacterium]